MIWDSNDEIGAMQEKYSLIFLNIDCDRKLSENKKLPTNAWIVTYLDKRKIAMKSKNPMILLWV